MLDKYDLIPTGRHDELPWRNESTQKPPKQALFVHETNADTVLKNAREHIASVWRGDFHNAKQVLAAMKKRLHKNSTRAADADIQAAFHRHRMQQAQQSRLLNMLAVEIGTGFVLDLPRAPDVRAALHDVYGQANDAPFLLPLNQLLGFIGAHEWHKKGVDIPALGGKIHVPFGVFSPLRGEYLDLLMQAPLPESCQHAFDIGTGSGVLAALLARRGVPHITATDTNPRAIACARANLQRLGLEKQVQIEAVDLFPAARADLIVCNPPWLPAKPSSLIETALYDPNSQMLRAFLSGVAKHLNEQGQAWLIMSNLAELIGLRGADDLNTWIADAGLRLLAKHDTNPKHAKAQDSSDVLHAVRSKEITSLYCLVKQD